MIMNFPAPLFPNEQIALITDITAENLNKKIEFEMGAPMNARTLAAVKKYLFDFFSDLRPYLPITQGDLDNRAKIALDNFFTRADQKQEAKIFWLAICSFNNSLGKVFNDI